MALCLDNLHCSLVHPPHQSDIFIVGCVGADELYMPDYSTALSPDASVKAEPRLDDLTPSDSVIKQEPSATANYHPLSEELYTVKDESDQWHHRKENGLSAACHTSSGLVKLEPKQANEKGHVVQTNRASGLEGVGQAADELQLQEQGQRQHEQRQQQETKQQHEQQQRQEQWQQQEAEQQHEQWQQQQEEQKLATEAENAMDKLKKEHLRARYDSALNRKQQVCLQVLQASDWDLLHVRLGPPACMTGTTCMYDWAE